MIEIINKILAIVIIRIIEKLAQKYFTSRAEMFAVLIFAVIDVFIGNIEQTSHIATVFSLLTLSKKISAWCRIQPSRQLHVQSSL